MIKRWRNVCDGEIQNRGRWSVDWTTLLFPGSSQTLDHTGAWSHTALDPHSRQIPLQLTHSSPVIGHDEMGVTVNLEACDEVHYSVGCLVQ